MLRKLAELKRIQASYVDMGGRTCQASIETLQAILELQGVAASNERQLRDSLELALSTQHRNLIEPVLIAWNGKLAPLSVPSIPSIASTKATLRLENGQSTSADSRDLGRSLCRLFPPQHNPLPLGYHHVEIEHGNHVLRTLVISAPTRSYSCSEDKLRQRERKGSRQKARVERHRTLDVLPSGKWGAFMPLYALESKQSWGAGNIGDLQRLADWVAGQGGGILSTLPLLAGVLNGKAFDPSPYSPITRLFWNEFYVDVERLPEFRQSAAAQKKFLSASFQKRLKAARRSQWVDYAQQMRLRREVLEILAQHFFEGANETVEMSLNESGSSSSKDFDSFVRERPLVKDYARFRAIYDRLGAAWQQWPERLCEGKVRPGDCDPLDERYHLYAQWAAQRQMEKLTEHCCRRGIRFYLDLPVGVSRSGFDVWRNQQLFASEASAGAPPDMFFSKGQNWGFPPMIPERLRETGYQHVIDYLRFQMRPAAILRIDHVMGLHRLYWIPPGFSAEQGAYVRYPAEELHAIVCLESHRNRCEIIGENLGTVPEEVNQAMDRHGHGKMYVVQFEQRSKSEALRSPPKHVVASLNTHDTCTFAAHWRGLDIPFRAKLGLLTKDQVQQEKRRRKELNRCTAEFLRRKELLRGDRADALAVMKALFQWLGEGDAETVLVWLEDLWGETQPQNVPGTFNEYRNWSRKASRSLEEI